MSRLESLLSRMFGPAACGLVATAHLTAFTALGIRRNAARHVECRKGYHTRHHAAGCCHPIVRAVRKPFLANLELLRNQGARELVSTLAGLRAKSQLWRD